MSLYYVLGCSHTTGTGRSLPKNNNWVKQLGDLRPNDQFVDRSLSGSCNARSVRLLTQEIVTGLQPADAVICQITYHDRVEIPNAHAFDEYNVYNVSAIKAAYDNPRHGAHQEWPYRKAIWPFWLSLYDTSVSPEQFEYNWYKALLSHMLTLQTLCDALQIPIYFICWPEIPASVKNTPTFHAIEKQLVLNWDDTTYGMSSILKSKGHSICLKERHDGTPDNHFMEDAHQTIAHALNEFIDHGVKLKPVTEDYPTINEDVFVYD